MATIQKLIKLSVSTVHGIRFFLIWINYDAFIWKKQLLLLVFMID